MLKNLFLVITLVLSGGANLRALELKDAEVGPGGICGGIAGYTCSNNEWCDYPEASACGVGDQIGKCAPRPEVCTDEFIPVCGCNGQTYSNSCQAKAAGYDVAYVGGCRTELKAN